MMAARRELLARKAATPFIAETLVTSLAEPPPSFASPPSVATSATASELHHAFETEQQEPSSGTVADMSRPKNGHAHPLRAFVLTLMYGRRPPGPMPGQMPAATAEALQVPCRQVMSLAEP